MRGLEQQLPIPLYIERIGLQDDEVTQHGPRSALLMCAGRAVGGSCSCLSGLLQLLLPAAVDQASSPTPDALGNFT